MNDDSNKVNPIIEKYKIWDVANKKWFRPTYPGPRLDVKGKMVNQLVTEEILFSMSGEMYMRKNTGVNAQVSANVIDCDQLIHVSQDLFIPCIYSGCKDLEESKVYAGHILRINDPEDESKIVVVFENGCFKGSWLPFFTEGEKRESDFVESDHSMPLEGLKLQKWKIIGHILETPELLTE